jgi:multiple sugar transport system substrate-binding protein
MGKLFVGILLALLLASVGTYLTAPPDQTERPIVFWKSDANPQRFDQINIFHDWLLKNNYRDKYNKPVMELQLDSANNQSKLIQAVSGVGGDVMDAKVSEFYPLGVLSDISKEAKELSFGLNSTYPGLKQSLFVDGKQYGYPCNVSAAGLWCNADTFEKYKMKAPPEIWDPKKFEEIGKKFVKRANEGKERREFFFCSGCQINFLTPISRSEGLDMFNETLTKCVLDDPRYVKLLKLLYKWTYEDHIFPSAAEVLSMNTESGYGGSSFSQFQSGNFAMIYTGRYCLIRFREFKRQINLSLSRIPQYKFQNAIIRTRSAILYKGSKYKDLAKLFFAYLADKEYNDYIIHGSDGLPPNPKYALNNPEYLRPKKYPNEGNTHERELNWAMTIALPEPYSPYYKSTGMDWQKYAMEKYFNSLCNAEEAAAETEDRINSAIRTTVNANEHLKKSYLQDCDLQKKIEKRRKSGEKIPASWIKNPFYLAYYASKGMLANGAAERKAE